MHMSHKSHKMKSLDWVECGAWGIWVGVKSLGKKAESRVWAWHWSPTDLRGLLLVHVYRKPMQGETKRCGLCVANYCTRPDMQARDASGEGESVRSGVYVCHKTVTSCAPVHRAEHQHSFLRIWYSPWLGWNTRTHTSCNTHTHQVYRFISTACYIWGIFFTVSVHFCSAAIKRTTSAKGYSERLNGDRPPPSTSFIESTCMQHTQTLLCRGSLNEPHISWSVWVNLSLSNTW